MSVGPLKVAVFGGSGCLGRQIVETLRAFGMVVTGYDRSNFSVDAPLASMRDDLARQPLDAIVNCIARTGLKSCDDDPGAALLANASFSQKLAAIASMVGTRYFYFGTEYAFPCNVSGKVYSEDDLVGPSTVYGLTKLLGEPPRSCKSFVTIRLPLLYGPTHERQIVGSMLRKLKNGETVRVADDVFSTPVCSIDVACFLAETIREGREFSDVVHLASAQVLSLFDTIRAFAAYHRCDRNLLPAKSADFVPDGSKPRFGGLVSLRAKVLPSPVESLHKLQPG